MKKHVPNTLTCCNLICGCIATHFALQAQPLGKELDSLADDITFGFAPAAIVFTLLRALFPTTACTTGTCPVAGLIPYAAFLIAAFSALRLAKFNLDERQSTSFIGLPTPANALFWGALGVHLQHSDLMQSSWMPAALLVGIALSCWVLIAEIPMFALKFKHFGWQGNGLRYGFILASALLLVLLQWQGFAAIIVLYVICSVIHNALQRNA